MYGIFHLHENHENQSNVSDIIRNLSLKNLAQNTINSLKKTYDTVDGRNPVQQLIGSLSRYLQCFLHPRGAGFLPSTVLPSHTMIANNHYEDPY